MPVAHVLDSTTFYREISTGVPMFFLHGNPTSSYRWRHILAATVVLVLVGSWFSAHSLTGWQYAI
jgi:pimeloyl-ACP methyl ester carboxylesterase